MSQNEASFVIALFVGKAYPSSFTPTCMNIMKGFKKTGVWPTNQQVAPSKASSTHRSTPEPGNNCNQLLSPN